MSFHEISIAVRAENQASATFRGLALDIANLGAAFGLLSNEQVKAVATLFTVIRTAQSFIPIIKAASVATWMQTAAQTAAGIATWMHAHGQLVLIAALTFGIGAIIAVTAALWAMERAHRAAAASVTLFNSAMASGAGYAFGSGRNLQRAGEEELRRRGIE